MDEKFDENSFNEQAITDVETARLALRWALDKIRGFHEEGLKTRQNLQEKSSQVTFLENQLKSKNSDIERGTRVHEEEMKSRQDSLEYQFRARLERLTEREKELEDKISKSEETLKQKEARLLEDYQKKSEELRGRWAQVEGELWQLRQEQLAKQQEFERVYGARLEEEKKKFAEEALLQKNSLELTYQNRIEELEKRERSAGEEMKKQEAVLKWAKDSFQKDTEDRERVLKQKDLAIDKKILEKNQEIEDYKVQVSLLEKQLEEFPAALKRRDEDLSRYKDAISSLDGVIRTLETEKKSQQADYELRLSKTADALEAEKNHYREMEAEIPKRLKIAVEHERNRFAEKLQEIEHNYREDLAKRHDEIEYLQRNLKTFEETIKTLQGEREAFSHKAEQMQVQYNVKLEEFAFREKQLQSEYDVRLKVEIEKHTGALRAEIYTAGRIFEDSLRLKGEEIAHLRKELEEVSKDKSAGRERQAALLREIETLGERQQAELDAQKARLKDEYEQKLAAEAARFERFQAQEKERQVADAAASGQELSALKMALQKAGEDLRLAVAEERARGAAAMEEKAARQGDTLSLKDEKIGELARALEASKLEREELILLERERLQRLYSEKEKVMDEELAARDAELSRSREAYARAAAEKETVAAGAAAERRALEEKLAAQNSRLAEAEASYGLKLESAVRRESERYADILGRKNIELEAASQLRQAQEDGYRKTLDAFRSKLADALGRFETLKKTAEDRQAQLTILQAELAQERKSCQESSAHVSGRLAEKERDLKSLRAEYDDFKAAFEEEIKEGETRYNDAVGKFRVSEEQRAAKDKQLEQYKRESEFWRQEISRKDEEISGIKNSALKALETERKELRLTHDKAAQEASQKEKELSRELALLKDAIIAGDSAFSELQLRVESQRKNEERLKARLQEESAMRELAEARAEEAAADAAKKEEEAAKTGQLVEQLKEKLKLWKSK